MRELYLSARTAPENGNFVSERRDQMTTTTKAAHTPGIYDGPCQLCMNGEEKAQYLLIDGQWQPWPLVASKPDDVPCMRLRCHVCDEAGYREDAAEINGRIAAAKVTGAA